MAGKENCWEMKGCGREPGGSRAAELGVCPAAALRPAQGINGGRGAGRICWAVAGTMCGDRVQGTFAAKEPSCILCEVFQRVRLEDGRAFRLLLPGQTYRRGLPRTSAG
ncbi:MAG: hypothetical protein M0031_07660 [Thermaerobacter sp.]|jgi:hypothetical protein|nr:hypothetical protein [Thermaerobacter sp.]